MFKRDSPPRVFISYSHESPLHSDAVLALAHELRAAGVDAWLDVFEVSPPEGWPRWMQRQVELADHVLCVCTATYRRRFDGDPGAGRGVAWEGLLAAQLIYDAGSQNRGRRFLAVVLDGHDPDAVPLPLRPFGTLRWPHDKDYVLRVLFGLPGASPTPLGPREPVDSAAPASAGLGSVVRPTGSPDDAADALPPGLAEAYLAGDLVAFVGADVPLAAGLPAGDALPLAVLREAAARLDASAAAEVTAEVQAALADHAPTEALGLLEHELGRATFNGIVTDLLDDQRRGSPIPAVARAIAALAPTLRAIVTTNVDHILEGALRGLPERWTSHPQPTATLDERPHWLTHLRGAVGEDPRRWAFTEADLRQSVHREPLVAALLQSLLLSRSALFVGFNLGDPDIAGILDRIAALTGGRGRRHFALVDVANDRSLRAQRRRELIAAGVVVVPCGHDGGAFGGVLAVLAALERLQGPR